MGIFSKTMNKQGAMAGMVCGITFTAGYILMFKGVFFEPLIENKPENWLFGILGMLINFTVAFVVSRFTANVPDQIQQMVEDIRYPRGAGGAQNH